jgi:hypothetical protein
VSDERIVDVSTILSKWHDLLKDRWPNFPCQTFTMFMHNNSQELVRCRECKHYTPTICHRLNTVVKPFDFCSYGKPKMDGGADNV